MAFRNRRPARRVDTPLAGSEAFRILRSNVQVALTDLERPSVAITSAAAGEGKTSTCANLALALAHAGARVVVADLDMRHPDIHNLFGARNDKGVSDVLNEDCALNEALQLIDLDEGSGFYMLSAGSRVDNPTELLSSGRTARLLDALAQKADVLLLDTPPVLPVADTLVISRMTAGALLVVELRRTPITAVEQAKDALTRAQARVLGVVVNKVAGRDAGYGFGYGYGG